MYFVIFRGVIFGQIRQLWTFSNHLFKFTMLHLTLHNTRSRRDFQNDLLQFSHLLIFCYFSYLLNIPPIPLFLCNISPLLKIPLPRWYPSSPLHCTSPLLQTETVVGVRYLALRALFTKYLRPLCLARTQANN